MDAFERYLANETERLAAHGLPRECVECGDPADDTEALPLVRRAGGRRVNPLGVAMVLALAFLLIAAGLVIAFVAKPLDGANLIAAPTLIAAGGAILARVHIVSGRNAR